MHRRSETELDSRALSSFTLLTWRSRAIARETLLEKLRFCYFSAGFASVDGASKRRYGGAAQWAAQRAASKPHI
jgi:hypothetical protein